MLNRKYRCVIYDKKINKYFVKFSFNGIKKNLGPFDEKYKAAFEYDRYILWLNGKDNAHKTIVNFPYQKEVIQVLNERINNNNGEVVKEYYVKFHEDYQCNNEWLDKFVNMKSLISIYKNTLNKVNIDRSYDKDNNISKKRKKTNKNYDELCKDGYSKRVSFPAQVRNKVASRQKWSCNICNELFDELFIVDHIKPLFCRGGNDKYNLQALCPKCDKFKTGILDNRIKKLVDNNINIDTKCIFEMQNSSFFEKECIEMPSKNELIEFQKFKKMNSLPFSKDYTNIPLNFYKQFHNNNLMYPYFMHNNNMNNNNIMNNMNNMNIMNMNN